MFLVVFNILRLCIINFLAAERSFSKSPCLPTATRSNLPLEDAHGDDEEVLDNGAFPISELRNLNIKEIAIIESGLSVLDLFKL